MSKFVYDISKAAVRHDLRTWGKPIEDKYVESEKFLRLKLKLRATYIKWLNKEAKNV